MTMGGRTLDFLVIGAPKSATTTMWRGLQSHPQLCLPGDKERGLFNSPERLALGLDHYLAEAFPAATPEQRLGTVTPAYMLSAGLEEVVRRMQATVPDVRLVAILRDPIERAVSRFRQALRRGTARGTTLDDHLANLVPGDEDVIADGEYGRILSVYLSAFAREQLHVLFTEDFALRPASSYRAIFEHLGVDAGHLPPAEPRLNVGGTRSRVASEDLEALIAHLRERVWPRVPDRREPQRALEWWLRHLWNIEPDAEARAVSPGLRRELQERYLADATLLATEVGVGAPWAADYRLALRAGRPAA